jgi:ATP-binding cassette, subfamily C, bacterial EexD
MGTKPNVSESLSHEIKAARQAIRSSIISLWVYSFFINILMLAAPIYMLAVYDVVMPSKSTQTLLFVTLVIVLAFVAMGILEHVRSQVAIRLGNRLDMLLGKRVYDASFDAAVTYAGRSSTEPMRDLNAIKTFLAGSAAISFMDAPWFPIYLGLMFMFSPVFGFFGLGATLLIILLTVLNEKATRTGLKEAGDLNRSALNHMGNTLRNVEVVESMGMRPHLYERWKLRYHEFLRTQTATSETVSVYTNASKTLRVMASSLMYGVGALLAIAGSISPGMIIAGAVLMGRALQPIAQVVAGWKSFSSAREAYTRLNKLLLEFPEAPEAHKLPEPKGDLAFERVILIPPGAEKPVLKSISFAVLPGETVGIIGPSAAGKSSLVKAAVGFWKPASGDVRLDGAKIEQYTSEVVGEHVGYLPQDIELFEGSISENISRFRGDDQGKVLAAAEMAGVHHMILKLPEGYETRVGPGGATLSGGQRQRIGLARALYGVPKLIILDEPNSNLDDVGEQALMRAIVDAKAKGSTVIVVTHKTNLLGLMDKILLMQEGEIKLFGPKNDVLGALKKQSEAFKKTQIANKGDANAN